MESVFTQSCIANRCESYRISTFLKSLKNSSPKWIRTLPVVIIIFFNCQPPHPPETLLQVGAIQVNAEKLTRYLKNFHQKQNLKTLTPAAVLDFVQTELVAELRLLNVAQAENYHQHPGVIHKCRLMEKKFLTAGDGLIYRRFLADSLGVTEANTDNYRQQLEQYAAVLKQQLLDSVTISVNQPVFEAFYQKNYTSGYYFRREILEKFTDTERAQHFFAFDSTEVTLGEWIDYYRSYPVVRIIENRAMLHEHLEQFVFEQFAELKQHHERQLVTPKETFRYFTPSTIPFAPHSQIVFTMKIDSITAPIKIPKQTAYLLIKNVSHFPSKPLSFIDSQEEIRKNLVAERLPVFRGQWEQALKEKYKISINQQLISEYFETQGRYLNF